jgi:hypothetical protein
LNAEGATLAGELEALESAISEAERRVQVAKAAEARAADETKAKALLELADEFDAQVRKLSDAGDALVAACNAIASTYSKTYALGAQRPTRQQLDIMLARVVVTTIMTAGLNQQTGTSFLPPDERRNADALLQYGQVIRGDASARIGDTNAKAA